MADYVNPGGAFSGGFESFLNTRAAQSHQNLLDSLAMKREERLAQAELDAMAEKRDALAQKKEKDQQDAHDKAVADLEKETANMVEGDRPDPEMLAKAQKLGKTSMFRQPAAPASVETMQPPAALRPNAPPEAPAEGATVPTPEGALSVQAPVYPGSPKEREATAARTRQKAFIDNLPDDNPHKQELKTMFEAEAAGLKVPAGGFSKPAAELGEAVFRQNAAKGTVQRLQNGAWVDWSGDVPKGAHFMTEPQPKDTTAHDLARESHLQTAKEHAFKRINDEMGKGELSKIVASDDIATALSQNSNVADATLAPLVLKATITAGGNSGFRMTRPEIESVLTKSVWDNLELKLRSWDGGAQSLILTDEQKRAMKQLATAIRAKAAKSYSSLLDAEDDINASENDHEVNAHVTKLKRRFVADPNEEKTTVTAPTTRVRHDMNGNVIK